jgi:hypothetical protein
LSHWYLAAEATNTPVWWLFAATVALALVTGALATAAFKALEQLRVALQQLEEVRRDRHVQVSATWASTRPKLLRGLGDDRARWVTRKRSVVENFGGVAVDEWKRWHLAVKKLQETDPLAYVLFEELAKEAEKQDPGRPPPG